jgi:CO/xanthine dehydrogenase Mo-binding subunit
MKMEKLKRVSTEFEGRVYEETIVVEGEGLSAWEAGASLSVVGKPKTRIDGPERVTGKSTYTADLHLPGMLYGKILRSPHAHARIKRIDTSRAEDFPGVRAVLTYKNIPEIPFHGEVLVLEGTLRYAGDEVACVIAEDEEVCEDALKLIEVEYTKLPFVLDPEEALKPGAPKVHPRGNLWKDRPSLYERGDIQQGFRDADMVVEEVFRTQAALHNCLETHGSVALWEGDHLTVWDSTQHIFGVRAQMAQFLQLPLDKVRVIKHFMGGGFGSKNHVGKYTLLAALGARMTGRPVKIILDRHEENLATGNRPASIQHLRIGSKRDGTLTAIHLVAYSAAGAFVIIPPPVGGPVRQLYTCPNVKTEQYVVLTHSGPMSAFRGPGYVEGTFALESLMDELARKLGMDPLDLRLKNYSEINQITGQPYSAKGLREAYARGAEAIGWVGRKKGSQGTKRRGFGMASQIWGGSGGPPAYAFVKINPDGTAALVTGTQDLGTGTKTALAQIAAEELGLSLARVTVEIGDTQTGPYSPISAGSMTLASMGPAVRFAAYDARQQLLAIGAQFLDVPEEKLEIKDGRFQSPMLENNIPVSDVLANLKNFMVLGRGARAPNPEGLSVNTFGAQFVALEVDTETGEATVEKVVAVHDSGRVVNPLLISSQIQGGVFQGQGFGLMEQRIIDRASGIVLNANLEDYKVVTAMDVPEIVPEMIDRPDLQANNLGLKGIGEPPIIPTPAAIANAIADALEVRINELPLTRDRVLQVLQAQGRKT